MQSPIQPFFHAQSDCSQKRRFALSKTRSGATMMTREFGAELSVCRESQRSTARPRARARCSGRFARLNVRHFSPETPTALSSVSMCAQPVWLLISGGIPPLDIGGNRTRGNFRLTANCLFANNLTRSVLIKSRFPSNKSHPTPANCLRNKRKEPGGTFL